MSVRSVGARYFVNTGKDKHFILIPSYLNHLLVVERHYKWFKSFRWLNSKYDFNSKAKYDMKC